MLSAALFSTLRGLCRRFSEEAQVGKMQAGKAACGYFSGLLPIDSCPWAGVDGIG
jgi:hypothetical protein